MCDASPYRLWDAGLGGADRLRHPVSPKIPSRSPKRATQSPPAKTRDQKNKNAYQGKDEISLPSLDPRRKQPPVVLDAGPTNAMAEETTEPQGKTVLGFIKGLIKD